MNKCKNISQLQQVFLDKKTNEGSAVLSLLGKGRKKAQKKRRKACFENIRVPDPNPNPKATVLPMV